MTIVFENNQNQINGEPPVCYDLIADKYDGLFLSNEFEEENEEVYGMISDYLGGNILDIGCGTGLLIDLHGGKLIKNYTGVDPSQRMLDVFMAKHGQYRGKLICSKYEKETLGRFDFIVSLFGSMNYIPPKYWKRIFENLTNDGKYFLMFYNIDYFPVTYTKTGVDFPHSRTDKQYIESIYDVVFKFNNYLIATNIRDLYQKQSTVF